MDIKFIWIKEHRLLKDLNFNFCHDGLHEFKYEDEKIVISNKPKDPLDFGNNITNITGIAGKNGSGKSSFCEIILASTATIQNGSFGYNYLFDGIICYGNHFFIQKDIKIDNEKELSDLKYVIIRFNESPFEVMRPEWRESFIRGGFIYYSNYLDKSSAQEEKNLANISTQNCLLNDRIYSTYPVYFLKSGDDYFKFDRFTQFESHIIQEDYRKLRFISKFPKMISFIGNHTKVILHSSYSGNNRYLKHKNELGSVGEALSEFESEIMKEIYPNSFLTIEDNKEILVDSNNIKKLILKLYKLNIIAASFNSRDHKIDSETIGEFIYEDKVPVYLKTKKIEELIKTFESLLSVGRINEKFNPYSLHTWYEKYKDWRFYAIEHVLIPVNSKTLKQFERLIDLEDEILNFEDNSIKRISNYTISPYLSSGQSSFLSLFSRLYDVIIRNKKGIDDREKLILFLDEPDVGFHPEWSRTFLNQLIDFINKDFHNYKFQIILTTHSPYVLSDLPSTNVRLLEKTGSSSPSISLPKTETFGANIYDLLKDDFFMEKGFIGEFAKNKIDNVFKDLNDEIEDKVTLDQVRKNEIKSIISVIGEPLIKHQLSKMYDKLYETDLEINAIDEQIKKLEEFKNRKQKKGNDKN